MRAITLLLCVSLFLLSAQARASSPPEGAIGDGSFVTCKLILRVTPGVQGDEIATLLEGQQLNLLEKEWGGYVKIRASASSEPAVGQVEGWALKRCVSEPHKAIVDSLNWPAFGGALALVTWIAGSYFAWRFKTAEVMLNFQREYINLKTDTSSGGIVGRKYWALQHYQFTLWRRSLLPRSTYEFWVQRVVKNRADVDLSWSEVEADYDGTHFQRFMREISKISGIDGKDDRKKIKVILNEFSLRLRSIVTVAACLAIGLLCLTLIYWP